jgi:hypothetical protein
MEKRIYIIIPRNLDVPGDPPQKVTVTCGVQGGYSGHAGALLQRELIRETLRSHWLHTVICDHEGKKDAAACACGTWISPAQPSVGEAVERWIDHVLEMAVDVSFQFIMTLMVPHSHALDDAMFWLAQNNIRYWKYLDEDKKFPGQVPAALITEPLDEEQAKCLRAYKPWRCACNSVHNNSTEREHA